MLNGSLQEKNGIYYACFRIKERNGKVTNHSISTGIKVKAGNKRLAEEKKREILERYEGMADTELDNSLFCDYMAQFLERKKPLWQPSTYDGYCFNFKKRIEPYFRKRKLKTKDVKPKDIEEYWLPLYKSLDNPGGLSGKTLLNDIRFMNEVMKDACKNGYLKQNPVELADKPKQKKPRHTWYGETELVSLFKSIRGTDMELPVYFGIYFGLRRSEAIGMRWSAIDLDGRTMTVCGKVTRCKINGKWCDIYSDELKTEESARTFELNEEHCRYLREWHERQMNIVKKYHLTDADTDFVCVNSVGNRLKLDHVTDKFSELLKKFGMRHIRFHDLRHSCISELAMQFPMAMVQRYAGHANYATTANVYTHVDNAAKLSELDALTQAIPLFGKPTVEKEKEPLNA